MTYYILCLGTGDGSAVKHSQRKRKPSAADLSQCDIDECDHDHQHGEDIKDHDVGRGGMGENLTALND